MIQILLSILGIALEEGSGEFQALVFACLALIIILTCVFIDMLYRVFSHFWRA